MIHKQNANSDIGFWVLARPADRLSATAREVIAQFYHTEPTHCESVYELFARLGAIGPDNLAILITRPTMLAKQHLAAALQGRPNLRLIGWLEPDENSDGRDAAARSAPPMVTVSNRKQLAAVIGAMGGTLTDMPTPPGQPQQPPAEPTKTPETTKKLDPADYRLSSDELDALLGGRIK